jgi:Ca2+-binding RTX toxin-like protein
MAGKKKTAAIVSPVITDADLALYQNDSDHAPKHGSGGNPGKPKDHVSHGEGKGKGHNEGHEDGHGHGGGHHGTRLNYIFGTDQAETIVGTDGNDVIDGRGGSDIINGGDGDDTIVGQAVKIVDGNYSTDYNYGGAGNDTYIQIAGSNFFNGEQGDDTVVVSGTAAKYAVYRIGLDSYYAYNTLPDTFDAVTLFGVERVKFADGSTVTLDFTPSGDGTSGDDHLFAGPGGPAVNGLDGNDYILGSSAGDTLSGGDGDDTIFGAGGNDIILGGGGNDTIDAGTGATIDGGDGDDQISGNGQTITGGAGSDHFIIYTYVPNQPTVITDFAIEDIIYLGGQYGAPATWNAHQDGANAVIESGQISIVLQNVDSALLMNGSNDSIVLTQVTPPPADLTIFGTEGNDFLSGGDGNDTIDALGGADYVYGGNGNDTVIAGMSMDQLYGDAGIDTLVLSGVWSDYYFDYGSFNGVNDVMILLDRRDAGQLLTPGTDGWDMFAGFEFIQFADVKITMTEFVDRGNETFIGTDGYDYIRSGFGDDVINGGGGSDTILGGSGNNVIDGGADDDFIVVDHGSSKLMGGAGNDNLFDTFGSSVAVYSGNVADYQITRTGLTDFQITDTISGRDGWDNTHGLTNAVFADGAVDLVDLSGPGIITDGDDVLFASLTDSIIDGGLGNDYILGWTGNDVLSGGAGSDYINATVGNDTIYGGDGNDNLDGAEGDDVINGGVGNDNLYGSVGNDIFTGGSGADTFNFSDVDTYDQTTDTITDFTVGEDVISMRFYGGPTTFADLSVSSDAAGDAVIELGYGSHHIILQHVTASSLTASQFVFA